MSHTVAIKTQFNNWEAFKSGLAKLGWEIKEKSKARTYPSDPDRNKIYDWIAVNPDKGYNAYDVGISQNAEGEISLHWDPYGGSIAKGLGQDFCELKKNYVVAVTEQYYEEVQILEMLADGSIILEADDGE